MERTDTKFRRVKVDTQPEADLVTGLIVSTKFCTAIVPILDLSLFKGSNYKTIASWVVKYFQKHQKHPHKTITNIYEEKKENLDDARASSISQFLAELSDNYKYEDTEGGEHRDFDSEYQIEKAKEYLIGRATSLHRDKLKNAAQEDLIGIVSDYQNQIRILGSFITDDWSVLDINEASDGKEVFTMEIHDPIWLIRNVVPKGLILFAGKSKLGKSSFVSNLALSMAQGKKTCKNLTVRSGKVLFINLEDPKRLIMRRVRDVESDPELEELKKNLTFHFVWPKLNQGGLEKIEEWIIDQGKGALLVIIDTLEGVRTRPKGGQKGYFYSDDYHTLLPLKNLTKKYKDVSIMVVTHTTKSRQVDVFTEIGGTMGIQAVTDTIVVWSRPENNPKIRTFSVIGKEVHEEHYTFKLEEGTKYRQEFLGKANEYSKSTGQQAIIDLLKDENRPMMCKEIYEGVGDDYSSLDSVRTVLSRMAEAGSISRIGKGYAHDSYLGEKQRKRLNK